MLKQIVTILILINLIFCTNEIRELEPKSVFNAFWEISQIPRCSTKERQIRSTYIRKFASNNNFRMIEDDYGNCVVYIPASSGFENKKAIVIQSHLDMVCEKNRNSNHNFDNDPLKLVFKDSKKDYIIANGTTLGGDNGIGMALSLGLVLDKSFKHGPLELLMTVEEEIGLVGALNLGPNLLKGTSLLNVDTSTFGQVTISCAGGKSFHSDVSIQHETEALPTIDILIRGGFGGHSGKDINKNRANAVKLLGRIFRKLQLNEISFRIKSVLSGDKRNALAREGDATIGINITELGKIRKLLEELEKEIHDEYKETDPNIKLSIANQRVESTFLTRKLEKDLILMLNLSPHGVIKMSGEIPGLVETSINFASVISDEKKIRFLYSIRSAIDASKNEVFDRVVLLSNLVSGEIEVVSDYPGWKPNLNSPLNKIAKDTFNKLFNEDPNIVATHSGLEPGVIASKYPQLENLMISFGAHVDWNHSIEEQLKIDTVPKAYQWLIEIIKSLNERQ